MNERLAYPHFLALLASLTLLSISCALLEVAAPEPSPAGAPTVVAFPTVVLPSSASTFDHNTLTGQAAPAFTLSDANDQPYTVTPNDGRKHLVVFYMVYT